MISLGIEPSTAVSGTLVPTIVLALGLLLVITTIVMNRRKHTFRVPATMESIRAVVDQVQESAQKAHLDEQAIYQCRLAIDEACTNIIEHSYANFTDGEIEVVLKIQRGLEIHLIDFGEPYDPSAIPDPNIGSSIEHMSPGGLGLFLMRTVMDEVYYHPSPQGNRLTMVKRR